MFMASFGKEASGLKNIGSKVWSPFFFFSFWNWIILFLAEFDEIERDFYETALETFLTFLVFF